MTSILISLLGKTILLRAFDLPLSSKNKIFQAILSQSSGVQGGQASRRPAG
jgi:hypothetical protein